LFEPVFRNGVGNSQEEEEQDDDARRRLQSQHSVVSNWDQLSGLRQDDTFLPAVNGAAHEDGERGGKDEPFPLTDSPLAATAASTSTAASENNSPKVMKGPAQLISQSRQSYLKTMAEKKAAMKPPTFSDALRNITADDKIAESEPRQVAAEAAVEENEEEFFVASNGRDAETADVIVTPPPPVCDRNEDDDDDDDDVDGDGECEKGDSPAKIVWKLPPDENKKKKKKAKKKKQ
jgi:hypothetical protein